jgi:hypothetical protein
MRRERLLLVAVALGFAMLQPLITLAQRQMESRGFQKAVAPPNSHIGSQDSEAMRVILARYKAGVQPIKKGDTGVVTFPIPGLYREQVPLTFDITTIPANALKNYRIHKREDGGNWVCEATIKPPSEGAIITWESLVLVSGRKEPTLPKAKVSAPQAVAQWTRSTACVQSADPEIRAKSEQLASGAGDVESYVRQVIAFTSANRGAGKRFDALDAKSALGCGGSCTSRANLAAALLRAHGIPARTLSYLPAWYCGPLFENWLVEYWHPNVGWVWVESTVAKFQPSPNELVVLAVSNPDDEDRSADLIHQRCTMPGAAYLSGCELSKELTWSRILKNADGPNSTVVEGQLQGTPQEVQSLLEAAHKNFARLSTHSVASGQSPARIKAILTDARGGKAGELTAALKRN